MPPPATSCTPWSNRCSRSNSTRRDRLAELLAGSEDAQWLYIREMNLHAGLAWDAGTLGENDECGMMNDELAADARGRQPAGNSSFILHLSSIHVSRRHALFCYTLAALVLGVGLLAARQWPASGGGRAGSIGQLAVRTPPSIDMARTACVGRVTGMSGCNWGDPKSWGRDRRCCWSAANIACQRARNWNWPTTPGPTLLSKARRSTSSRRRTVDTWSRARPRSAWAWSGEGRAARKSVFWLGTPAGDLVNRGGEFAVFIKTTPAENTALAYIEVFRGEVRVGVPSENYDAIVLDSRAPAYIAVDAKRTRVYYGNKQLSPTILAPIAERVVGLHEGERDEAGGRRLSAAAFPILDRATSRRIFPQGDEQMNGP